MEMLSIDVKSLLLLFALCNLFIFFFFSFYTVYYREGNQLFRLLIVSKLMMMTVWVLFYLRGQIDDIFSIYLANALLLFATCYEVYYVVYAIRSFDHGKFWRFNLVPILFCLIFFFNVGQPESVRVIIVSLLTGSVYLYCGIHLYRQKPATKIQTLISYFYLLMSVFFLSKPLLNHNLEVFSTGSFLHLTAFTLGFLTSFLSAMFMLLIQKEADQHEISENHQLLMQSYESRNKFFSLVAHDLRSPLSSLVQLMEILDKGMLDEDPQSRSEMIAMISKELSQTYSFTENLLEWALSEKGMIKPSHEEVNLLDLINRNVALAQRDAASKGIKLHVDIDDQLVLSLDKNMFSTVVRNLLTNAIKFTPHRGVISIFDEYYHGNGSLKLHVKDTGVGIPQKMLSRLFALDSQYTTKGTNNEKGTGFGLKLCAELVHKLNGKIYAARNEDVGSTITIELPK